MFQFSLEITSVINSVPHIISDLQTSSGYHRDITVNESWEQRLYVVHHVGLYLWKRSSGAGALGGHRKHSGDAQSHSGGSCVHIDPKRHPGEDDNEQGGNVHLDEVVAHLTLQMEFNLNAGEFTCSSSRIPNTRDNVSFVTPKEKLSVCV